MLLLLLRWWRLLPPLWRYCYQWLCLLWRHCPHWRHCCHCCRRCCLQLCARLKFIGIGLRIRSHSLGIRWGATWPGVHARWRMRLRFRLADPSLKIFTIKRKLHPLIGLDWFGEVTNVSIARWSYCCRVDEIDYDYGREKREGEKETWK